MKSTIKIPMDKLHRHLVTIPKEIWEGENLTEGDLIELDIKKIKNPSEIEESLYNLKKNRCYLWTKPELNKFDASTHSIEINIMNIDIDPIKTIEYMNEIKKNLSELEEIRPLMPEYCWEYFTKLEGSIANCFKKAIYK
jgi:hypothetical protein